MLFEKLHLNGSLIILSVFIFLTSCNRLQKNASHKNIPNARILEGKRLAETYCQSCHLLPDPSWADSKTWQKGILPNMGPRFGIFNFKNVRYPSSKYDLDAKDFYPDKRILTDDQWQRIIDYYTATSPDSIIEKQNRPYPIKKHLPQFSVIKSSFVYAVPSISFVKIDTSSSSKRIIISDAIKKKIYFFDKQLQRTDSLQTRGSVADIELNKNGWISCDIGLLKPNNGLYGQAERIIKRGEKIIDDTVIFSKLARPVQILTADMNNDGRQDEIVCEFGFLRGRLSLMENEGNGKYKKIVLREYPGTIKAYVDDYNHDGLLDLWVLFAQGEEGIFLFTNQGNNQFKQEQVLRFPPIYGSSYFELVDFNNDGKTDILYTCGDNADYSTILKPYHGMYIFLNDGKNHFTQKYFYPLNGCYKAIARDFDGDGDLDIATISYFADYKNQPEEGFVYFEQNKPFDFIPYSTPEIQEGRWLTMDAGDFDNDGKTDLILGNFSAAPGYIKSSTDWKKGPLFLILKNNGKQ